MKKYWFFILPLLAFLAITAFLLSGLFSNPRYVNESQVDRQAPPFKLPDVMDAGQFYDQTVFQGQVTLLNVWGVWCVTCAVELPYLTQLRQQGVRIVGLYYEQELDPDFGAKSLPQIQAEVQQRLQKLGNPYQFNIFDVDRSYSLDLGVTGAPETFLIDQNGKIRLHHIGDVNPRVWQQKIAPLYQLLSRQ
ncbi:DsbE family thiol:disulfide interchange protein [Neptunicella sp. SCSIO 80796]|uniref:DsbE family thiol:disulfide interchange protein n=1 Tax=Neptunicella plasticusilytica TaxID=3117012 RepID=UPI003A4D2851